MGCETSREEAVSGQDEGCCGKGGIRTGSPNGDVSREIAKIWIEKQGNDDSSYRNWIEKEGQDGKSYRKDTIVKKAGRVLYDPWAAEEEGGVEVAQVHSEAGGNVSVVDLSKDIRAAKHALEVII